MIELGCKAVDVASGHRGTVIAISEYIGGQTKALVMPESKDNEYPVSIWIDMGRLQRIPGDCIMSPNESVAWKLNNEVKNV